VQFAKARKLRCFATGTTSRIPQLSEVPTVAEQGLTLRGAMPREGTDCLLTRHAADQR
jgi:tripartite-type tricarboxylate transporter receptor subunit TctC